MEGSCPAHIDVGLVEGLQHFDKVGALPLLGQRQINSECSSLNPQLLSVDFMVNGSVMHAGDGAKTIA